MEGIKYAIYQKLFQIAADLENLNFRIEKLIIFLI